MMMFLWKQWPTEYIWAVRLSWILNSFYRVWCFLDKSLFYCVKFSDAKLKVTMMYMLLCKSVAKFTLFLCIKKIRVQKTKINTLYLNDGNDYVMIYLFIHVISSLLAPAVNMIISICSSDPQAAVASASWRQTRRSPTRRRCVVTSSRYFQHGVVRLEAKFLGEWTKARTALLVPRRRQQRSRHSVRAGQTHAVSDSLRHSRSRLSVNLTRSCALAFVYAPQQCCIIMEKL